ncbi:unnamed protein product [Mytilus edulis]|uniref:C1q domain-containing protein n=1 Tax=Mytilus edulis TaxID=6550 RepID=A0A8S3VBA3_MYTED|nr:unnamed protein product [Mytilus edulis]
MYSDEYIPNERLSLRKVEMVYQKEVMKITKNRSYMGIWQLFSLSSILCRPLFSVYPMLGNPNVRNDLHRLILPRQNIGLETAYVMWTTTRTDMNETNWVPNHFVAALKIENEISENIREPEQMADKSVGANSQKVLDIEMEEKDTIENFDPNDVTPQYLVDRYVLVEYDNKPYPGKVIDCDEAEVYVTCMHRLGKTLRTSTFYWPLAVRDKCWYGKKPPVLFYAVIVKRAFTLNKHSTIVFETVIINEGDHYNKNDGVFVAPQNGIYMFSWTVATVNVHYIVTELVVEDEVVTTTGEKEIDSGSLTSASMTVFYRMKRDEHAWIRTNNWGTENFVHSTGNYPQSSFLGILIHAE